MIGTLFRCAEKIYLNKRKSFLLICCSLFFSICTRTSLCRHINNGKWIIRPSTYQCTDKATRKEHSLSDKLPCIRSIVFDIHNDWPASTNSIFISNNSTSDGYPLVEYGNNAVSWMPGRKLAKKLVEGEEILFHWNKLEVLKFFTVGGSFHRKKESEVKLPGE